jgi:Ca-activated chloride channel family protein
MSNDPSSTPEVNGHDAREDGNPRIEARWERPVVPAAGGEATLLVRVVAPNQEGDRGAPLDVAFVLDRSGSMAHGKLDLAKEGVDLATARLRDADRAALVVYDDDIDVVQPLAAATPRLKANLRLALHGVDPGGSTFLSGGWTAGCAQLAEAPGLASENGTETRIRRVILLTDGLANVGITNPMQLARHAGELRRRGIATTTLGVGSDFDEGLLSAMAEAGGGNFQYIADPGQLREFFSRELQELFSVAATGFIVTMKLPEGVHGELVSAFPVERRGKEFNVAIGDLPAEDEIDLVFTLRVRSGAAGDRLPVRVTASWTDPRADARHESDVSPLPLCRATPEEIEIAASDPLVAERAALQRAAAERRAGLELDRQGDYAASRARMRASAKYLLMAPETDAVLADLRESRAYAAEPTTAAYSSHARKLAQHREDLRRRGRFARLADDER